MSLFSNEQKHRKVKKKIQGPCLDPLQNSLQLQKVRNDDSEDLQQHTWKTSQAAGVSPWIWHYTSGFAALATKSEVGALWAGKIKLDKKAAFVRNALSLRDILKVHVLFFFFKLKKKSNVNIFVGVEILSRICLAFAFSTAGEGDAMLFFLKQLEIYCQC